MHGARMDVVDMAGYSVHDAIFDRIFAEWLVSNGVSQIAHRSGQ